MKSCPAFVMLFLWKLTARSGFPWKVPAQWEPVIPEIADIVVGVIGLDCLGKKIADTAHRPEDVAGFLGENVEDIVTWENVAKIAVAKTGLQKGVGKRRFLVYLNKADVLESLDPAEKIVERCRIKGVEAVCGEPAVRWSTL